MRIIVLDSTLNSDLIGGAQTFLSSLLARLTSRGHQVSLLTQGQPNPKISTAIEASGAKLRNDVWDPARLVDDNISGVVDFLNRGGPDVYVVSVSGDIGWAVLPALRPAIATVAIVHSNSTGFYDPLRYYHRFTTRAVGVSEEICEQLTRYCDLPSSRIDWIPYGVRCSSAPPVRIGSGALKLAYVGRLAERDKRASDVIRVARGLTTAKTSYTLSVVGDGPLMPEFRVELIAEIACGSVRLHGWLDSESLIGILRDSEASLLVSESEGFPIAIMEAMANGCAPIVTDIPSGTRRLVRDGENGFVVPVGDIAAFVDRIRLLAADRELLMAMRRRAWETGREYSIDRMIDSYERCFQRAIEDARADPRRPDPGFPLMASCRSKYPLWLRRIKARLMGAR